MASAGAIRAGRAFVELFADDSRLRRGLKSAEKRLKAYGGSVRKIGAGMLGFGAALAGGLGAAVSKFSAMGDQLDKMSARTGVAVESLSALGFAAGRSGAGVEAVEKGLRGMARMMLTAEQGSTEAIESLDALGLTLSDLEGLDPEAQFKLLASRLEAIEDPTRKAGLAMKVFGKSGVELLPMLKDVDALTKKARELGIVMSTEDSKAAAEFADAFSDVQEQLKAVAFQVGAALAPALTDLSRSLSENLIGAIEWVKANSGLILSVGKLTVGVIGIGAALTALGAAISGVGAALGILGTVLTALASPIGLIVLAVAGLGAAFLTLTDTGREMFAGLKQTFSDTLGGIADALKAGDIGLAAKILWAGLKLAWLQGTQGLREMWIEFKHFMVDSFFVVSAEFQKMWERIKATHQGAVDSLAQTDLITRFAAFIEGADAEETERALRENIASRKGNEVPLDQRLPAIDEQRNRNITASGENADAERAALEQGLADLKAELETLNQTAAAGALGQPPEPPALPGDESAGGRAADRLRAPQLSSAILAGSKEAIQTINRSIAAGLGGGKKDPVEKHTKKAADELAESNETLAEISDKLGALQNLELGSI